MENFNINVAQPFQGLNAVIGQDLERKKQSGLQEQAKALYESGDLNALANFSISNPELGQSVREQVKHKSAATEAMRRDVGRKILMGGDHTKIVREGADQIRRAGGDPKDMLELLYMQPEEVVDATEKMMAIQFPADFNAMQAYKQSKAPKEKTYEQVTDKPGWAFDKTTGLSSIDPEYQKYLQTDAGILSQKEVLGAKDLAGVNDKVSSLISSPLAIYAATKDLVSLEEGGSVTDQIAAVFKFMKSLDDTSSVREGELGMVYSAEGAAQGFANSINAILGGGQINATNFKAIVDTAKRLSNSSTSSGSEALDGYLGVIQDNMTPKQYQKIRDRMPKQFAMTTKVKY